mmetsp:Transcript_15129/g.39317  ORF Transcript_15129/g.39317 Transcript_15129/m.39317 type:complete len:250 (-) Transcript_15129:544-1293(-)
MFRTTGEASLNHTALQVQLPPPQRMGAGRPWAVRVGTSRHRHPPSLAPSGRGAPEAASQPTAASPAPGPASAGRVAAYAAFARGLALHGMRCTRRLSSLISSASDLGVSLSCTTCRASLAHCPVITSTPTSKKKRFSNSSAPLASYLGSASMNACGISAQCLRALRWCTMWYPSLKVKRLSSTARQLYVLVKSFSGWAGSTKMCCEKLPNMSVSELFTTGMSSVHSAAVGCACRAYTTSTAQPASSAAE